MQKIISFNRIVININSLKNTKVLVKIKKILWLDLSIFKCYHHLMVEF